MMKTMTALYKQNVEHKMSRVFAVIYVATITFQCFMHYNLMGYHGSILFWWLLNFGVASLIWDGYKVKK